MNGRTSGITEMGAVYLINNLFSILITSNISPLISLRLNMSFKHGKERLGMFGGFMAKSS